MTPSASPWRKRSGTRVIRRDLKNCSTTGLSHKRGSLFLLCGLMMFVRWGNSSALSGTSSMRGGFIKIDLCIDKSSVLSYNIDKERAYQQTVCSHNVVKITARSCKQGRLFLFILVIAVICITIFMIIVNVKDQTCEI